MIFWDYGLRGWVEANEGRHDDASSSYEKKPAELKRKFATVYLSPHPCFASRRSRLGQKVIRSDPSKSQIGQPVAGYVIS